METKEGDTVVVVYFDDIEKKELCPVFKAYRTHKVAKQRPAPVVIYDYYDNCEIKIIFKFQKFITYLFIARRATQFYSAKTAGLCDICDEEDCGETCKVKAYKRVSERSEKSLNNEPRAADEKDVSSQLSSPITILVLIAITRIILRV